MHRNLPSASGSRLNMRLWIPGTEVVEGWRYRLWWIWTLKLPGRRRDVPYMWNLLPPDPWTSDRCKLWYRLPVAQLMLQGSAVCYRTRSNNAILDIKHSVTDTRNQAKEGTPYFPSDNASNSSFLRLFVIESAYTHIPQTPNSTMRIVFPRPCRRPFERSYDGTYQALSYTTPPLAFHMPTLRLISASVCCIGLSFMSRDILR